MFSDNVLGHFSSSVLSQEDATNVKIDIVITPDLANTKEETWLAGWCRQIASFR